MGPQVRHLLSARTSTPPLLAQDAPISGDGWRSSNQRVLHRHGPPTGRHLLLASRRQDDGERHAGRMAPHQPNQDRPELQLHDVGWRRDSSSADIVDGRRRLPDPSKISGATWLARTGKRSSASSTAAGHRPDRNDPVDVVSYSEYQQRLDRWNQIQLPGARLHDRGNSGIQQHGHDQHSVPCSQRPAMWCSTPSEATARVGAWTPVADATAAGGSRLNNPNARGRGQLRAGKSRELFEMDFTVPAGVGFRIWLRGKAYNNSGRKRLRPRAILRQRQLSGGSAIYRIGTTSGTYVNLAEASGATLQGWGWQDNGFGTGVLGRWCTRHSGTHTTPRAGARRRLSLSTRSCCHRIPT